MLAILTIIIYHYFSNSYTEVLIIIIFLNLDLILKIEAGRERSYII